MEDAVEGSTTVSGAFLLGSEVVAVSAASTVGEELAAALVLVEEEPGDVSRTDTLVTDLRAGV